VPGGREYKFSTALKIE